MSTKESCVHTFSCWNSLHFINIISYSVHFPNCFWKVTQLTDVVNTNCYVCMHVPIKWSCSSLSFWDNSFMAFRNSGYLNTRCKYIDNTIGIIQQLFTCIGLISNDSSVNECSFLGFLAARNCWSASFSVCSVYIAKMSSITGYFCI